MAGMAAALDEKGYAAATIADIVRHARVSKRTFYEHFADKEDCFLASYRAASEHALQVVAAAAEGEGDWPERVRAAAHAYLAALQREPALTRTLLMEVHAAGPRALALRRTVLARFADLLCELVARARAEAPGLRELTPAMSAALVGGINELVLLAVEHGDAERLTELEETTADLVTAVLSADRSVFRGSSEN